MREVSDNNPNQAYSVAGVVVHTKPENLAKTTELLNAMSGVEVHGANEEGKLVVTVEENPGEKVILDRISEIHATEGVLTAALVYTQNDSEAADDFVLEEQQQ